MHGGTFLGDPFMSALRFRDSADEKSIFLRGPWDESLLTPLLGPFTPGPGQVHLNATKASSCPLCRATCYVQDITAGDGPVAAAGHLR